MLEPYFDPDDDERYIHRHIETVTMLRHDGDASATETIWVAADEFMDVQKERDQLRRWLAFINAHAAENLPDRHLRALLDRAGFTVEEGRVMRGLLEQARNGFK